MMIMKFKPFPIMLPQTSRYINTYDNENKFMSVLSVEDYETLRRYNKIWDKASNSIKRKIDSKSLYNKKYLKNKIKSYQSKTTTDSDDKCILFLRIV